MHILSTHIISQPNEQTLFIIVFMITMSIDDYKYSVWLS